MKMRTMIVLILIILFGWVFWRSGTLERQQTVIPSDVPGAPDKGSVQYRLNWGNFSGYLRGLIPG